jgi:hypothetical protein
MSQERNKGARNEDFLMPDLRVLPSEALVPHEHADWKRVSRLEGRLRSDGYLKNPPIVAPIEGTGKFVVLDGANRTGALANIGCRHVLAQVVGYKSEGVQLLTWSHLITGRNSSTFLEEIRSVPGLEVQGASFWEARAGLASRDILAYVVTPPGDGEAGSRVFTVSTEQGRGDDTALLNAMVDTYKSDPLVSIHRVGSDDLDAMLPYYDSVSGLIVFPPYRPDDIMTLAMTGVRVPTGITRHIISPRALRVNVPLSLLMGEGTLAEKNEWWLEETKRRLASNQIRLYQEATYLFDE